jgi:putative SOS response-associated peptidase YedK
MCSNYQAITDLLRLQRYLQVDIENLPPFDREVYPVRPAPIVRALEEGAGTRRADLALFGLLPFFAKDKNFGRRTYNARSETVATLPSFKHAWGRGQRCIIPADRIYEPCYESGKPVRWAIEHEDGSPLGIAGIWADSPLVRDASGGNQLSFAMLTVTGDGHPIFQRMHAPQDEKRMVVILEAADISRWLDAPREDARELLKPYAGALRSFAAPRPPRRPRPVQPPLALEPSEGAAVEPGDARRMR